MNRLSKRLLALVLALLVGVVVAGCGGGGSSSSSSGGSKNLTLGVAAGWTENTAIANLSKVVMEDELGYKVKTQTADLGVVFQGVGNGDLDAFQDMWLPNHQAQLDTVKNKVTRLPQWYTGPTTFSIVVPKYMNITSIDQLNSTGAKEIIGIDPGAVIMGAIEDNTIPKYGLNQKLIQSSEAAMLSEVKKRYAAKEPFAFIGWKPHWMNATYDITYLKDPKNTLVNPQGDSLGQAKISAIAREDLEQDDPAAFAFLKAIKMNEEQTNTLEAEINKQGTDDPTKGARAWFNSHKDVVQPWIDAAKQAQKS